jgi:hypothetical protein
MNSLSFPFVICCAHLVVLDCITLMTVVRCRITKCEDFSPIVFLHSGGWNQGPLETAATWWPIVSAPGDYDNGEIGGMIGRGNRSTRRKPTPEPLCPPQTPNAARTRTRAAAVGSQRLTAELRHGRSPIVYSRFLFSPFLQIKKIFSSTQWTLSSS